MQNPPKPSRVLFLLSGLVLACLTAMPLWAVATSPPNTPIIPYAMVTALAGTMLCVSFYVVGHFTVRLSFTSASKLKIKWGAYPRVGVCRLPWTRVEDISVDGILIAIRARDEVIFVNTAVFVNPEEVARFIHERMSDARLL
ncbi:MAG: hypothetical protein WBW32_03615 [Luteibacter sp.]